MFEITPIENHDGILFKRDDYFKPFSDSKINGGKVRQAIKLIEENIDIIKSRYDSTVINAVSVYSPQGSIISRVCKEFGLKCKILIANNLDVNSVLNKHPNLAEIVENGHEVEIIAKMGFQSNLESKLIKKYSNRYFNAGFGFIHSHSTGSYLKFIENDDTAIIKTSPIIDATAEQCFNIPDNLTNLIIPCGSGLSANGILKGLKKFNKKIKYIYVVQINGKDRLKNVNNSDLDFNFVKYNEFPYSHQVKYKISEGFELDSIYEAKAFDWLYKRANTLDDYKDGKTLFWVIANMNHYHESHK